VSKGIKTQFNSNLEVRKSFGTRYPETTRKAGPRTRTTETSRTAQTIAENYEECVFRRFGASEVIRHDREPGFMADFFKAFNRIIG
jgi:hypothetical protein